MYRKYFKRIIDIGLCLLALIILSPVLVLLSICGLVFMGGNPYFVQERPGKHGKIFKLIKFRTMSFKTDKNGVLLPDEERLNKYGKLLRATSLDELPELLNILKGDMSIVGPRPLLVQYLPLYSKEQNRRHDVRPGLTGWAQVNGRNAISWTKKFEFDVEYVDNISFWKDLYIMFLTVKYVLLREGINSDTAATMEDFDGTN